MKKYTNKIKEDNVDIKTMFEETEKAISRFKRAMKPIKLKELTKKIGEDELLKLTKATKKKLLESTIIGGEKLLKDTKKTINATINTWNDKIEQLENRLNDLTFSGSSPKI